MTRLLLGMGVAVAFAFGTGCKRESVEQKTSPRAEKASHDGHAHAETTDDGHEHYEGDGNDHSEHAHENDHGHGHGEETDLGTFAIGDMGVSVAQGHGAVGPGKEGYLVLKLPYGDKGATAVRAWIGTEDRTLSFVGKGVYAPSHDDYDIHAIAPKPLPQNVMWWIEIEKPDGTKVVGSVKPLLD